VWLLAGWYPIALAESVGHSNVCCQPGRILIRQSESYAMFRDNLLFVNKYLIVCRVVSLCSALLCVAGLLCDA
jgi:hypothetical protein